MQNEPTLSWSHNTRLRLAITVLFSLCLGWLSDGGAVASRSTMGSNQTLPPAESTPTPEPALYLPLIEGAQIMPTLSPTVPAASLPARQWDSRLQQRGTVIKEGAVASGNGYWRLVRGVWYDEQESQGRHHIWVDLIDAEGKRVANVPVRFYWNSGQTVIHTGAKPGEPYAADFGMFDVAPSYGAVPADGNPADDVWGMGLGSIEQPKFKIHSSYGLVWQWTTQGETMTPTPTTTPTTTDLVPTVTPTLIPLPTLSSREWDPRLIQRGAALKEVNVGLGNGYWRLVRGIWYNEPESQGRHHIFIDLLDPAGKRVVGVPMKFYWNGGSATIQTQAKPGELYAADFAMNEIAPSYGVLPSDGNPADDVWGMGLGSIEQPGVKILSSYGFVWQWTVHPVPTPTATPTATPTVMSATATPTSVISYLFNRAELARCNPNAGITYVQGTVRLGGQAANGFAVAFSYAPDGPIVAEVISGPHTGYEGWNPGYYSHLLSVSGPRRRLVVLGRGCPS